MDGFGLSRKSNWKTWKGNERKKV